MVEKMEKDYPKPSVTVDIVIFSVKDSQLKVLLVNRNIEPFRGKWAIPGGFVRIEENLEDAAKRELEEETGVRDVYLEQLYTFGDTNRDPRGRVITVSYFALVNSDKMKLEARTDVSKAAWFSVNKLPELAFDHKKIMEYALKRLRWKFEYTTVAFSLLPKKFTLSEVQKIYETIFSKKFDKRNFRKKLISLGIFNDEEKIKGVSYRPPQLFSLKKKIGDVVEIIKPSYD
jgi:8-oxo-dGTP diphosphatase